MKLIFFFSLALLITLWGKPLTAREILDLNQLCVKSNNLGACSVTSHKLYEDLRCKYLLCARHIKYPDGLHYEEPIQQPPDGTPCGVQKICQMSNCVHDTKGVATNYQYDPNAEYECRLKPQTVLVLENYIKSASPANH